MFVLLASFLSETSAPGQSLAVQIILPVTGVVIGWMLKSITDFLVATGKERADRKKCTFYLVRAWKALFDYEQFLSSATLARPEIEQYEKRRVMLAEQFLSRIAEDRDSLVTGVDMLASLDPIAAAKLDSTIKQIRWALQPTSSADTKDPRAYVSMINSQNDLIAWTLSHFEQMAQKLARRSGFIQNRKLGAWFENSRRSSKQSNDGPRWDMTRIGEDKLRRIFCDPIEWHKAKWTATLFHLEQEPPGLGIGFRNFEAGKRIFEGWIERVGHVDDSGKILVSIIEGPVAGEPDGYTVVISMSVPDKDEETAALSHRMISLDGSPNLQRFKKAYAAAGRYCLFPAHVTRPSGRIEKVDLSLSIEKSDLRFFKTSESNVSGN